MFLALERPLPVLLAVLLLGLGWLSVRLAGRP
jgi:APA family basic amino acid/polyamine antiporter